MFRTPGPTRLGWCQSRRYRDNQPFTGARTRKDERMHSPYPGCVPMSVSSEQLDGATLGLCTYKQFRWRILFRGLSSESQSAARSCIHQPPQPLRGTAFLSLGGSSSLKQYPASSLIPCTLKMAHLFHPPFSCFCPSEPYQTGREVIHVHFRSCTQSSFSILRLRFEGSGLLRVSPDGFHWEAIIPEPPFPHQ